MGWSKKTSGQMMASPAYRQLTQTLLLRIFRERRTLRSETPRCCAVDHTIWSASELPTFRNSSDGCVLKRCRCGTTKALAENLHYTHGSSDRGSLKSTPA